MNTPVIYQYPQCSTCKKALKWLDENKISYTAIHIVENTPDAATIKSLIEKSDLPIKKFFNTSGKRYRELNLKEKLADLTIGDASALLASDGMLIKRPLLVADEIILTGFRLEEWERSLKA